MKTNDLKKGDRVLLRNGLYATIADNMRGNTRIITATTGGGYCTETGSVYSHDIVLFIDTNSDVSIKHTQSQIKLRAKIERLGL